MHAAQKITTIEQWYFFVSEINTQTVKNISFFIFAIISCRRDRLLVFFSSNSLYRQPCLCQTLISCLTTSIHFVFGPSLHRFHSKHISAIFSTTSSPFFLSTYPNHIGKFSLIFLCLFFNFNKNIFRVIRSVCKIYACKMCT